MNRWRIGREYLIATHPANIASILVLTHVYHAQILTFILILIKVNVSPYVTRPLFSLSQTQLQDSVWLSVGHHGLSKDRDATAHVQEDTILSLNNAY